MHNRTVLCIIFTASMFLNGCAGVRTYTEDKDRVDQVLTEGNQGYLMGQPREGGLPKNRKTTRRTYVTEIELGFRHSKDKIASGGAGGVKKEVVEEISPEPILQEAPAAEGGMPTVPMKSGVAVETQAATLDIPKVTSYTVEPNDTLQKISQKVYGSTKKWKKIFDANSGQLKSPDRIYAGQVLNIPQE